MLLIKFIIKVLRIIEEENRMKSQIELIRNLQYFVFNFLSFYEQSFSKVLINSKKIKIVKVARLLDNIKSAYYFLFI